MTHDPIAIFSAVAFDLFVALAAWNVARKVRESYEERVRRHYRDPKFRAAMFELLRAERYQLAYCMSREGREANPFRAAFYVVRAWFIRREIATIKARLQQGEPAF